MTAWCQQGFLTDLLARAEEHGFETWLTADHGNVVATAGGAPPEGLKVNDQGTRLRLYRTQETRDASAHLGVPWDPFRVCRPTSTSSSPHIAKDSIVTDSG